MQKIEREEISEENVEQIEEFRYLGSQIMTDERV